MRRIPKYRRFKHVYARVTIEGRDIHLGRYGTDESKAEYDRVISEWLAGRNAPEKKRNPKPEHTVGELADAFWKWGVEYYGGAEVSRMRGYKPLLDTLKDQYGDLATKKFKPPKLIALQHHFIQKDNSRTTVNMHTARLKKVFRWGVTRGMVPAKVNTELAAVSGIEKGCAGAREGRKVRPVPEAVVEATLKHLTPVLQAMVQIQRLTGARPGEITKMRPMDIDRSGDVWTYKPESHKTEHHNKDRTIHLGPIAQRILAPYLLRDERAPCFSPIESEQQRYEAMHEARKTPLSCGNKPSGRRRADIKHYYDKDSYRRAITRAAKAAKVQHWSPNQLRHLRGTEIRKQYGYESANVVLGHATNITEVYAEKNHELAARIAKQTG